MKVSVIVPVYNTEKYLCKCLNSLVGQTLDEIEIIIVNDGSPDNSQDIINQFKENYPDKITAIRQENRGLGQARNTGIAAAKGQYIGFVDSDDFAEPDMFEEMLETAQQDGSDVVLCDYRCIYEHNNTARVFKGWPGKKEAPETIADFVLYSTNPAYSWARLYKKELLIQTPFPAGYYEDIAATPIILSHCRRISYAQKPLYNYSRREGTISSDAHNPRNLEVINAWTRCFDESNPEYIQEIAYAVYYSITEFIEYKPGCAISYLKYFQENKQRFTDNSYINDAVKANNLTSLFEIKKDPRTSGGAINPYAQNITDFLNETQILAEQFETLPPETQKELRGMHNTMLMLAVRNIIDVGEDLLSKLTDRLSQVTAAELY